MPHSHTLGKEEDYVEPCCEEDLCENCKADTDELFSSTFYFDNHRITLHGCAEAVGEAEAILGDKLKGRIPKMKEQ